MEEYVIALLPPGEVTAVVASWQERTFRDHSLTSGLALPVHLPLAVSAQPIWLGHPATQPPAPRAAAAVPLQRIAVPPLTLGEPVLANGGLYLKVSHPGHSAALSTWLLGWLSDAAEWCQHRGETLQPGPGFMLVAPGETPPLDVAANLTAAGRRFSRATLAVLRVEFAEQRNWWCHAEWQITQTLPLRRAAAPGSAG